jgi:hypothetical protein
MEGYAGGGFYGEDFADGAGCVEIEVYMSKQYCVIHDSETGGAVIGTVSLSAEVLVGAQRIEDVRKAATEKPANWHHPAAPTLLEVVEGSHVIWVQNRGVAQSVKLEVGDEILFLDFEEDRVVAAGAHPGHWSQQGSGGLVALRQVLATVPDLAAIGFHALA